MFLSTFELFKIGIGPSSSHTNGPMIAASRFVRAMGPHRGQIARVRATLYGSLAWTGKGHRTDEAVILGLAGQQPDRFDAQQAAKLLEQIRQEGRIFWPDLPTGEGFGFAPETDLVFDYDTPPGLHPNALRFEAFAPDGAPVLCEGYYSTGGGFVATGEEMHQKVSTEGATEVPWPIDSADRMLALAREHGLTPAQFQEANEQTLRSPGEVGQGLDRIREVMQACMERGLHTEGTLPGGLQVQRRAAGLYANLVEETRRNRWADHTAMEFLSAFAMAVNEENAAGGQVVTAPTNGAAGVIPAVMRHFLEHLPGGSPEGVRTFLLTAALFGGIIKRNASISGAEMGCQGEVGSASAMAAAGLCAALGGQPTQIENAAEIALEHHLGMTCDPIQGLVQVPCIERNAMGAIKAVAAARLALRGDGRHLVSFDQCLATMRQTGLDMHEKYRETSKGGLAVHYVAC